VKELVFHSNSAVIDTEKESLHWEGTKPRGKMMMLTLLLKSRVYICTFKVISMSLTPI
jgi:hypothetical protein